MKHVIQALATAVLLLGAGTAYAADTMRACCEKVKPGEKMECCDKMKSSPAPAPTPSQPGSQPQPQAPHQH